MSKAHSRYQSYVICPKKKGGERVLQNQELKSFQHVMLDDLTTNYIGF